MSFIVKLFGGRPARETRQDSTFENAFLPLVQQGAGYAKEYLDLVAPTFAEGKAALAPVQKYQGDILKGGQAMFDALAPELSAESTAYKNISSSSTFAPRGSGQVSRQGQLDTQHLKSIADIVGKARPAAADAMASISSLLLNLGVAQANLSTGQTGTIGSLLQNWKNTNLQERGMRTNQLNQTMASIGSFIGGLG